MQHLVEGGELGIDGDEGIGAEHLSRLQLEDPLELVAQARPDVVGAGLERHPEDADAHAGQVVAALQAGDQVEGQALVDHHARLAEGEVVVVERCELHRVLEQAWPRSEARPRHVGSAGVLVHQRRPDPLEVDAEVVGDHVELVGRGELDVAPGVDEQLRQLRFLHGEVDDAAGEVPEQLIGPLGRLARAPRDDLRQLVELGQRVALRDALRAEAEVDLPPEPADEALDQGGHAGVDGAAQHQELAVHEVGGKLLDGLQHLLGLGVEMLVEGCPHRENEVLGLGDDLGAGGGPEPSVAEQALEDLGRAGLLEGHLAARHPGHGGGGGVVQRHGEVAVCQRDPQGQADPPAAPDDRHVAREGHVASYLGLAPAPGPAPVPPERRPRKRAGAGLPGL